jgi:hypothetical protein
MGKNILEDHTAFDLPTRLHCVIIQKITTKIFAAVPISNLYNRFIFHGEILREEYTQNAEETFR